MKDKIHPKVEPVTITCTCGAKFKTISTLCKDFNVELCSHCHPFFTGKQRLVDTTGRVERFNKRYASFNKKKLDKPVDAPSSSEDKGENGAN